MAQLSSTKHLLVEAIRDTPAAVLRDMIAECCRESEIVAQMLTSKLFPSEVTSDNEIAPQDLLRAEIARLERNWERRPPRKRVPVAVCPLLLNY